MTEQERAIESAVATSPYLSLRRAVRPAILAHWLLAGDQERAGKLAAECEDLIFLTRELLKAAGRVRILAGPPPSAQMPESQESGGDRHAQLLDAYAEAGLLWAKVVGCSAALGHWRELGEVWRDDMYRLFGEALEEVTPGITQYLSATEGHEAHLATLIERLRGYLETGSGAGLGVSRPETSRTAGRGTDRGTGRRD